MRHLMLLPSLNCPASCSYCFGPRAGGSTMRRDTVAALVDWQNALSEGEKLEITFHGGEPLAAGLPFYQMVLPLLRDELAPKKVSFAIQSNLWLLREETCKLFREYHVSIGTSLDGPEAINDSQRGAGHYRRTWEGIQLARAHGLSPACICTFTAQSAQRAEEIFDFFLETDLGFSLHAALSPIRKPGNGGAPARWVLSPQAHGKLLVEMLERYLPNANRIRISTLDAMIRSISAGAGAICTFGDCLGEYLAVDPEGWIYPCQRFAGIGQFRLGSVHDRPDRETLQAAPAWRMLAQRQERIGEECGDCAQFEFCRGGCPYNLLAASGGKFNGTLRDPHCPAYQRAFEHITKRALEEVFSEQNLAAVAAGGSGKHGLLRKGRLLEIMRGGQHPQEVAQQARKVAAAVALASSASPDDAVEKLERAGIVSDRARGRRSLQGLQAQLLRQASGLANAYIHVTYACNLSCDHCYASAGPEQVGQAMPVEHVTRLARTAALAGFQKIVITGGEPLAHPQREALLEALAELRAETRTAQVVLRTNLAVPMTPALLELLRCNAGQVVVSVDGDEAAHDARRGAGAHACTLANLQELAQMENRPEIILAATLSAAQIEGAEGQAVRLLAEQLGVRARFKPVLPLGRASGAPLAPEFYSSLDEECDELVSRARLAATCGLGMNLYIDPGGACYPCYALTGANHALGNALMDGLEPVLARNNAYRQVTVDSNQKCRSCGVRYLCGGACRAWSSGEDPNAAPGDCAALQARAHGILNSALEALEIKTEQWCAAGLPAA